MLRKHVIVVVIIYVLSLAGTGQEDLVRTALLMPVFEACLLVFGLHYFEVLAHKNY